MSDHKTIRREIHFTGNVQGVGFRFQAQYAARGCGVTGWVKNEWDGSVLLQAQGTETQINEMLKLINASPYIRIEGLDIRDIPLENSERGFHINY